MSVTKTPAQKAGWEVGDRGVYFKDAHGVFSNNATVEFYEDDDTYAPLFRLVKGSCRYNHCNGEPGAYASLDNVRKLEGDNMNTTQTNGVRLQRGDYVEAHLIKNQEQFNKLVEAFVEAGAEGASSPIDILFEKDAVAVGWDARDNRVYAPTAPVGHLIQGACFHRSLTPEQVLGASSEEPQQQIETTVQNLLTEEEWKTYCKAKMIESGLDGDSESFEIWAEKYYRGG